MRAMITGRAGTTQGTSEAAEATTEAAYE